MPDFDLSRFLGTWHVVATTFPMWLKGDRTGPRLHYGQLPGTAGRMSDRVTFRKGGRERQILGTDTRLPGPDIAFRWRGKGMLRPLRSDWRITALDREYQWAVIAFDRSLFTPAGLDIIAREPSLPASAREPILGQTGPVPGLVFLAA